MPPPLKNFCPNTGVGRFDARLEGNQLKIKIKLHVVTALADSERTTFQSRFEPLVKQHWEDQYGFYCTNLAYPGVYKPVFQVKYVDTMMDAHFVLNLMDGVGGTESIARDHYFKVPKTHVGFAPTTAQLFSGSVLPTNSSAAILNDVRASFPFYVDLIGSTPSPHAGTQLKFLARQLAGIDANTHVQVTIYGSGRKQKRAEVMRILTAGGLTNVTERSSAKSIFSAKKSKSTGSTNYAKVSIKNGIDTTTFDVTTQPLFTYPAAVVHEFGHMLGLQDEYSCLSKKGANKMAELHFIDAAEQDQFEAFNPAHAATNPSDRVATGQERFITACRHANVEPPQFGQHTPSVMSSGSMFFPCHFVTLRDALVEMTNEDSWTIAKL